jgi:hypothetical protein
MRSRKIALCRVFLFCDLRTGLTYGQGGDVLGPDPHVYRDMDTLVAVARRHQVSLIPVLLDFTLADGVTHEGIDWTAVGEHPGFITDTRRTARLLERVIVPFVRRYRAEPMIYAWDIMNEPYNAKAVGRDQAARFVETCAAAVSAQTLGARVTVGYADCFRAASARSPACDLAQAHFYDHMAFEWDLAMPASAFSTRPVLLGELEPTDVEAKLRAVVSAGYVGALFWSLNADDGFDFRSVADTYRAWASGH